MKPAYLLACAFSFSVVACGGAQKPAETTGTSQAALTSPEAKGGGGEAKEKSAAEEWAEKKVASETKAKAPPRDSGDPLALNSDVEAASIPKIEMTPAKELRAKGKRDLYAAVETMRSATTVDEAAKRITGRVGKPTWTENGQKRIWVVMNGAKCHRLVLGPDGAADVEEASKTEWRSLSALAQQNPCTGEIKRGFASSK